MPRFPHSSAAWRRDDTKKRLTIGDHPPDIATVSHSIVLPLVKRTPWSLLPPWRGDRVAVPGRSRLRIGHGGFRAVDDDLDMHALGFEVARRPVSGIVVGEHDGGSARSRRITIDVSAHRGRQHHARDVVAAECYGTFLGSGSQHGALGDDPPIALARLERGGGQDVIVDAFLWPPKTLPSYHPNIVVRGINVTFGIDASSAMTPEAQSSPSASPISSRSNSKVPPSREPSSARMTRLPERAAASAAMRPVGPEPPSSSHGECCYWCSCEASRACHEQRAGSGRAEDAGCWAPIGFSFPFRGD